MTDRSTFVTPGTIRGPAVLSHAGPSAGGSIITMPKSLGNGGRPSVVLVHGAFTDGSSWQAVIPLLERDGYLVTAVQNALTSVADDVATTRRVIDAQPGPVVVVAHSYGGVVMTGAAAGRPNVQALVYTAAFAPDAGEALGPLFEQYPTEVGTAFRPDAAGFLYIDRARFHDVFCPDLPAAQASVMAATQRPLAGATFGQTVDAAAWKTIPAWFLVSQQDRVVHPDLQRFFAKRMGAQTSEVAASHVALLSHPAEIAALVEQAAAAVAGAGAR